MKKIHKIVLLLLISQNILAQRYNVPLNLPNYDNKPVHFGFLVGLNTLDFKLTSISNIEDELFVIQSQNQKGFNLGVVSNFRLANNLDFRFIPTLSLAERKISYTISENNITCVPKNLHMLIFYIQIVRVRHPNTVFYRLK